MSTMTGPRGLRGGYAPWDGVHLLWPFALLPFALLFSFLTRGDAAFAEAYTRFVTDFIARPVSRALGVLPFSLSELLLAVVAICVPLAFVLRAVSGRVLRAFCGLLGTVCLLFCIFAGGWGVAYSREPYAKAAGLTVEPATAIELENLCRELIAEANALRAEAAEDENGVWSTDLSTRQMLRCVQDAYDVASADNPWLRGKFGNPKPVMLSEALSHLNITGIFSPFTFEANVNTNTRAYMLASTACHEAAHLRGWAREDEANYIAYVVCRESGIPEFAYSGALLGVTHAMNALIAADSERGYALLAEYSDGVRRDLTDNNEYWARYDGAAGRVQERVNDVYLKANNQQDGVQSYGRMVDLMLAAWRGRD